MKWFIIISVFLLLSCETSIPDRINKITGKEVVQQGNTLTIQSNPLDTDGSPVLAFGHCWGTSTNPTLQDSSSSFAQLHRKEWFTDTLHQLIAYQTYTIRPYLQTTNSLTFGNSFTFSLEPQPLNLNLESIDAISETSLIVICKYTNQGSLYIQEQGVIIDTIGSLQPLMTLVDIDNSPSWLSNANGLKPEHEYRFRMFVKLNDTAFQYSNYELFTIHLFRTTTSGSIILNPTTAQLTANIVYPGPVPVTEYGFCWSYLNSNPNFNHNRINLGQNPTEGDYQAQLNDLIAGITYYFRAYGVANGKVFYGAIKSFTAPGQILQ